MNTTKSSICTKVNIKLHRTYGQIQSSIMTFGINKGYFISAGIALLSVAKVIYEGYLGGWQNISYDINTLWPFILTFISAIYATVSSIVNYRCCSYKFSIIQDNYYKDKVIDKMQLSEKQVVNGYSVKSFFNGANEEKYVMSDAVNVKLIDGPGIKVNKLSYKFQLADEIKQYVPSILKRNFMSDKLIFNGELVRMASDLYLDSDSINIQNVLYFDGQCTNEIVYKQIKSNYSLSPPFLGDCMLFDNDSILYDLNFSSCANYIGASTLAITKDNYIVIGQQGVFSRSNAGRYAPSGSGSVNYSDLKYSNNFNSLIINAMEREFCEENYYSLDKRDKIRTIAVGYVRLLERGGKPDFFGISFIDEYSYNLKSGIKQLELGLVENNLMLPVKDGLGIGQTLMSFCNENINERKISIQLMIIAEILLKYEDRIVEMLSGLKEK